MEFRVLGPLQVIAADRSEVVLPSASQRRLTCLLLTYAGTVVSTDALEWQLGLTAGALRTTVSRLRRLLDEDILLTTAPGYRLHTEQIDSLAFERNVEAAQPAGDPHEAITALHAALSLWRGAAYCEFAHERWAIAETRRPEELRAGAVEDLTEHLLTLGMHHQAIAQIDSLIESEPYRDRPRELLMRALADSGRRVEALRAFHDYRRLLDEEVGTEPSEHIVALDREIAAARRQQTTTSGGIARGDIARDNLPTPLTSFIGRASEITSLRELLKAYRLVTLTGAGGCGKSRLALHVAGDLLDTNPGGTWWVDLSSVSTSAHVAERVARVTGIVAPTCTDRLEQVARSLRHAGPSLIVLDNAEHVLDGAAAAVGELLGRCADLRVVVTSREPLALPGELVWRMSPLSTPPPDRTLDAHELLDFDAPALLVERIRSANPDLVIDAGTTPIIRSICERLDGLPLALELAAARTRTWRLEWILAGLDSTLDTLEGDSRGTSPHHRTLRASIAWSINLLEDVDRDVLARLSVFPASFSRDAAAAVAGDPTQQPLGLWESLGRLVNKNLVQFDPGSGRYTMLATIREFAHGLLVEAAQVDTAMAAFSRFVLRCCTEQADGMHTPSGPPAHVDTANLVVAMDWALGHAPEDARRMTIGLTGRRNTVRRPNPTTGHGLSASRSGEAVVSR